MIQFGISWPGKRPSNLNCDISRETRQNSLSACCWANEIYRGNSICFWVIWDKTARYKVCSIPQRFRGWIHPNSLQNSSHLWREYISTWFATWNHISTTVKNSNTWKFVCFIEKTKMLYDRIVRNKICEKVIIQILSIRIKQIFSW